MEYSASSPFLNSEFAVKIGTIHPRLNICFHTINGRMGFGVGRIEKERKQTLEEKSCLLITLSPVLINPSTGERNPNWKSNFNQDICVFCILFLRAERAKVRAMLVEALRKISRDKIRSFKLKNARVIFNFPAPQSVPFHLKASWRTISYYLESWVIWPFVNSIKYWHYFPPVRPVIQIWDYIPDKRKENNCTDLRLCQQYWAERKRL